MAKTKNQSPLNATKQTGELKVPGTSSFLSEDNVCFGLLAILLLLIWQIRSNFLLIPFERDEGIYSYFGNLVLEGKIPYKDFYEQKFPGIFYFYGLIVFLFGDTVKGMHTGFLILNLITIVLIYFSSRQLFSAVAGIISPLRLLLFHLPLTSVDLLCNPNMALHFS